MVWLKVYRVDYSPELRQTEEGTVLSRPTSRPAQLKVHVRACTFSDAHAQKNQPLPPTTHERTDAVRSVLEKVATSRLFIVADVTALLSVGIKSVPLERSQNRSRD